LLDEVAHLEWVEGHEPLRRGLDEIFIVGVGRLGSLTCEPHTCSHLQRKLGNRSCQPQSSREGYRRTRRGEPGACCFDR
jgi:hypothetical protein